jgi:hypothetical protein
MTPFRNDDGNPFARETPWPKMPQTPMRLGALPKATPPVAPPIAPPTPPPSPVRGFGLEPEAFAPPKVINPPTPAPDLAPTPAPTVEAAPAAPVPFAAPIERPRGRRRTEPRLTPLIAAGAVLAGGIGATFLMLGVRAGPKPAAAATPPGGLAVGELVSAGATARLPAVVPLAAPAPAQAAAATVAPAPPRPVPAPRLTRLSPAPQASVELAPAHLDIPPPAVRQTLEPAPPPPPPAPAQPFVRPAPPNPDAPFSSHVPDPG